jgi:aspartyl-tRNA(Asn)/glutamyl-tRNA(Gln) amidotransferase subunit C
VKITERDVRYVAALANLELSEQEATQFAADLDSILAYVEKMNELDTSAVPPMAQVLYDAPEELTFRPDGERPSFPQEKSLLNAPEKGAGHFKVAKVIER